MKLHLADDGGEIRQRRDDFPVPNEIASGRRGGSDFHAGSLSDEARLPTSPSLPTRRRGAGQGAVRGRAEISSPRCIERYAEHSPSLVTLPRREVAKKRPTVSSGRMSPVARAP